jgi:hypothetical protein
MEVGVGGGGIEVEVAMRNTNETAADHAINPKS